MSRVTGVVTAGRLSLSLFVRRRRTSRHTNTTEQKPKERKPHENPKEAAWNNSACGRVTHGKPCRDSRILVGLAKDLQHLSSRSAVCFGVELRMHCHRRPHVAAFSLRRSRLYCGDWIAAVPGEVHCSRWPDLCPFVRGDHSCRFSRLLVSPQVTWARRLTT